MDGAEGAPSDRIREIFEKVVSHLNDLRRIPVATYRLQFNHRFKFTDAMSIISYLHELGISDLYSSPYFMAKPGSLHGYDIVGYNLLNPEIGTEEEYQNLIHELGKYGMGQILDIVPNHMDITASENIWWMDVLENGRSSIYANFFDIDWDPIKNELKNKVLLPILGDQYGQVLENRELNLKFEGGAFFIQYGDHKLPIDPVSYARILGFSLDEFQGTGGENLHLQELLSILTALEHLPPQTEQNPQKIMERQREKEIIKKRIFALVGESDWLRERIERNVQIFNGEKGNCSSFDLLDALLNGQAYRLSHWRVATEEINYRRFFDVNDLAAIRVERPEVFRETHRLIFQLIREKKVTGLRVDHPDGLYNPAEYFFQLQKGCFAQICLQAMERDAGDSAREEIERLYEKRLFQAPSPSLRVPFYVVGEKILAQNEPMPEDWPIFGTTGYAFLNLVNGIFVDTGKAKTFENLYGRVIKSKASFPEMVYEKKKLIMQASLSGEINTLAHYLNSLAEKDRHTRDFTLNSLKTAILEVVACFPIYRTYLNDCGLIERDRYFLEQAIARARSKNPALSATLFDFLRTLLLLRYPENFSPTEKSAWLEFVMRFQQITASIMAKGLEDTVFYVFNRLVSLNEVGGNPDRFGTPLETFHGQNIQRAQKGNVDLVTTSTHDTKRTEDVRARLNVLSEIPEEWKSALSRWNRMNKKKKTLIDGRRVPDGNEEYLLYQTLLGTWPLQEPGEDERKLFEKRIQEYMLKAAREAKVNTSWISPHSDYEKGLLRFIEMLLSPSPGNLFLEDFKAFQHKIGYFGMCNSLSQILLKIASPGVPDFYQGTEIWNYSLVDPDNRRPVDFHILMRMLRALKDAMGRPRANLPGMTGELVRNWRDGNIKLYVTYRALNYRRENPSLFMEGVYLPLESAGKLKENICAFARKRNERAVLIAVPRFLTRVRQSGETFPLRETWENSWIVIPREIPARSFHNIFTGETIAGIERDGVRVLPLDQIWAHFPVSLMEAS